MVMTLAKKLSLAIGGLFALAVFMPVQSMAQSDMATDFLICDKLKDEDVRLACFSAIAAKMKGENVASDYAAPRQPRNTARGDDLVTVPRSYVERAPAAAVPPATGFGTEQLRGRDSSVQSETPKRLVANIVRKWDKPFGNIAIELDNGQVWETTEKPRLSFARVETVEIYKGMLSGYRLKAKGETGMARVKRVK